MKTALLISMGLYLFGNGAAYAASALPIQDPNVFVSLSKKVIPSVVNISTTTTLKKAQGPSPYGHPGNPDDLFRRFFGDLFRQYHGEGGPNDEGEDGPVPPGGPRGKRAPKAMSLGTGFVIDSSGLILTNHHVIADADEIKIQFTESPDEKPTDAEVVGKDPELDVALLKVKTSRELTVAPLGDSDALDVGEYVMAVGNPFGQGHSVTHGIISAKGRLSPDFPLANYLQTDAPINPGNSGGPLVNLKGEVIGINNAIDQRAQGIGFAIPISIVKKILPQLRSQGSVSRGYIGVLVGEVTPEISDQLKMKKDVKAPMVTHVYPNAPAEAAGLKPYDLVLEFNGKAIRNSNELIGAVTSVNVGETVPVKILRGTEEKVLSLKVAKRPGGPELAAHEKSKSPKHSSKPKKTPPLGMELEDVTQEIAKELGLKKPAGVVVERVQFGMPADEAGLTRGDVILEVDRRAVKDTEQFYSMITEKKSYLLRVRRGDSENSEGFLIVVLDLREGAKDKKASE